MATMEQYAFKNVNNCLNTNVCSYLETSSGQSSNPYLNVVHFLNARAEICGSLRQMFPAFVSNTCCSITAIKSFVVKAPGVSPRTSFVEKQV